MKLEESESKGEHMKTSKEDSEHDINTVLIHEILKI